MRGLAKVDRVAPNRLNPSRAFDLIRVATRPFFESIVVRTGHDADSTAVYVRSLRLDVGWEHFSDASHAAPAAGRAATWARTQACPLQLDKMYACLDSTRHWSHSTDRVEMTFEKHENTRTRSLRSNLRSNSGCFGTSNRGNRKLRELLAQIQTAIYMIISLRGARGLRI